LGKLLFIGTDHNASGYSLARLLCL